MALFPGTSPSGTLVDVSDRIARLMGAVRSNFYEVVEALNPDVTNPAGTFVFADTGPLNAGQWLITFLFGTTVATPAQFWGIQHRNAANNANIAGAGSGATSQISPAGLFAVTLLFTVAQNERIRLVAQVALTGTAGGSLTGGRIS